MPSNLFFVSDAVGIEYMMRMPLAFHDFSCVATQVSLARSSLAAFKTDKNSRSADHHHLAITAKNRLFRRGRLALDDCDKFPDIVLTNPLTTISCVHNANYSQLTQDFCTCLTPKFMSCLLRSRHLIHSNFLPQVGDAPFPLRDGQSELNSDCRTNDRK